MKYSEWLKVDIDINIHTTNSRERPTAVYWMTSMPRVQLYLKLWLISAASDSLLSSNYVWSEAHFILYIDSTHNYYKHHLYHYLSPIHLLHFLPRPSRCWGTITYRTITCQSILSHANFILSHANLFYHMLNHYESYLVIMPPFSILSLHNAKTAVEYKREAEFCTLVSSPP